MCLFELVEQKGELKIDVPENDDYMGLRGQINYCLQNNSFFESTPLTIRRHHNVRNSKNFKAHRIKTGANIEEVTTSFVFEKLNKEKIIPIKTSENIQGSDSSIYYPLIEDISNDIDSKYKDVIQDFINKEITILNDKLKKFEKNLTSKLKSYWEHVIKNVKIQTIDEQNRFRFISILEDGDNEIAFDTLSDGEKNLFNLIVSINTAKETKPDLIIIDEPEVYMHDDMIRKLVSEICTLSNELPETCIMLSTHNTVLIEELASLDESVNLIVFEDKQIYNSEQDIDFINALQNNGVRFSPLMISKKPNLFIENTGKQGAKHRDFYLKFFHPQNKPNVVHIGSSGQVKEHGKILETIENIVNVDKTHYHNGVIDGDVWLTMESKFQNYLFGDSDLEEVIILLKNQTEFYIPHSDKPNIYYFNCWEIENLYLLEELLVYWKASNESLTKDKYINILKGEKDRLCESWSKTFYRSQLKPIYFDKKVEDYETKLKEAKIELSKVKSQTSKIEQRLSDFFDELIKEDLLHWMPGKEVKALLESKKHKFENNHDFNDLEVAQEIRKIIQT